MIITLELNTDQTRILKMYDFELNLLFFKSVLELNPYDMFGFEVDIEKWNEVMTRKVYQSVP